MIIFFICNLFLYSSKTKTREELKKQIQSKKYANYNLDANYNKFEEDIFPFYEVIFHSKFSSEEWFYLIRCRYTNEQHILFVNENSSVDLEIKKKMIIDKLININDEIKIRYIKDKNEIENIRNTLNSILSKKRFFRIMDLFRNDLINTLKIFAVLYNVENVDLQIIIDDLNKIFFSLPNYYFEIFRCCQKLLNQDKFFDYTSLNVNTDYTSIKKSCEKLLDKHLPSEIILRDKCKKNSSFAWVNIIANNMRQYKDKNVKYPIFSYTYKLFCEESSIILKTISVFGISKFLVKNKMPESLNYYKLSKMLIYLYATSTKKCFTSFNEKDKCRFFLFEFIKDRKNVINLSTPEGLECLEKKNNNTIFNKIYKDILEYNSYSFIRLYIFSISQNRIQDDREFSKIKNSDELVLLVQLYDLIFKIKQKLFSLHWDQII